MTKSKSVGFALASFMTFGAVMGGIGGVEPAQADDWFDDVRENCERVNSGYFCRDSGRFGRHPGRGRGVVKRRWPERKDSRNGSTVYSRRRIREGRLYEGAIIQTRTYDNDRFDLRRGESRSLTLVVDQDVRSDSTGYVLIPRGSRILGKLRPHDGGVRYEADDIILTNGKRYDFDARSETIYSGRRRSSSRISSSAATVILGTILGRDRDLGAGDIIRGGDIFSGSGRRRNDDYISIRSNDLDLYLTDDFKVKN